MKANPEAMREPAPAADPLPEASPPVARRGGFPPRTLLWQTFFLIALLLTLALAAWSQIFRHFEDPVRARDLAQMVASVVNLTRTALINAESQRRTELLIELAALEGLRIYPAEPSDELSALPDTREMRLLTDEVRRQLGPHTRFASKWKTLEGFWVSFRLDPEDTQDFWMMLPSDRLEQTHALEWLAWGGGALLVALAGAYLIVSRISLPLRNLARSARVVGSGHTPPQLPETGPLEIATVARAFNQMAGDLARADADRALILAGVSHDLRTPLARLRLGIEMSGAPESDVLAMVADVEEMDRIIGQFLDFGRGEPQEPMQQTDVSALLADVIEPYRLRGVNVSLEAPRNLFLSARPLPLRRAVLNLLDNAIRYAGEDKPIHVAIARRDGEALVEVADRGPGIPEAEMARMRHPFTRLENARSNTKGAGLGLAIVERIVASHDGHLELRAREGGGLRAILHLPLDRAPKARSQPAAATEPRPQEQV